VKHKLILKIIISVILLTLLIVFTTLLIIRVKSNKYNLTEITYSNLPTPNEVYQDKYIDLDNITMHYYEFSGNGEPLVLLHGNGGSVNTLYEMATYLSTKYKVYLIESRCHGKSSDTDTITYELMADDTYQFINKLGLANPIFVGHSDGAMVGINMASKYPNIIKTLISCGANSKPSEFKLYFKAFVWINDLFKPSKLNKLMLNEPNFDKELLSKITCKTYIVAGEHDIMFLRDSVYLYESISNSEILIVKNQDHCGYIENDGKLGYSLVVNYLLKE